MDKIEKTLDNIQHLNSLTGDEYVVEAARLGFVVTEKGTYLNPDHPDLDFLSAADNLEMITRLFERHGHDWVLADADPAVS